MVNINNEVSEEWKKPSEGFNEDFESDSDFERIRFGRDGIDRIIDYVGKQQALPILLQLIDKMLQYNNDWRYPFAGIMGLSQIGEYVDDVGDIQKVISSIINYLNDNNPMIRYAVFHAIGQISDDMKPQFQEEYQNEILEIIIKYLDDEVPRVASHAAAALTNYVEGFNEDEIQPFLDILLKKLILLIKNGCSIVKENSMTAISSVVEAAKYHFDSYLDLLIPTLFEIFQTHQGKEYRQLRGQIIECITITSYSVSQQMFLKYLDQVVLLIINIQNNCILTDEYDPQKNYILSSWQRLCLKYSSKIQQHLPQLIPGLYNMIRNIINKCLQNQQDSKCDLEDMEVALCMLEVFILEFKQFFSLYVQQTIELVTPLCVFKYSQQIRTCASKCLPGLLICLKEQSENQHKIFKFFIKLLCDAAANEREREIVMVQIQLMKQCFEACNYELLTQEELCQFYQKIMNFLYNSEIKRGQIQKQKNDQENIELEEKQQIEDDLKKEDKLQIQIAELIQVIFKTHKTYSLIFCEQIEKEILTKAMDNNAPTNMQIFGLKLLNGIIQYLGYKTQAQKWDSFLKILLSFCTNDSSDIRSLAAQGIGFFIQESPSNIFVSCSHTIIKFLINSASMQYQGEKVESITSFGYMRDNVCIAIGKAIKNQKECLENFEEAFSAWIQYLPIKFDQKEGRIQHKMLALFALEENSLIIQNASKVLQIFAIVHGSKFTDNEVNGLIVQAVQKIAQDKQIQQNWDQIWKKYTLQQKNKIQKMLQL